MRHILVADDYKPFLVEVQQTLGVRDTIVHTVESSAEAISQLQQSPDGFDLVVTDLFMETQTAEDGLAVLREAKSHAFTQIIVVTAYGDPQLSVQTMQLGAFDYLERGTPGTNFRAMLLSKVKLALDYRDAKRMAEQAR